MKTGGFLQMGGWRGPVKHEQAEQALLLLLAGFAGAVIVTRLFLKWTGYPQIASGEFHIAHVLWGGLLLFLAALLLLVWRGRRFYRLGSLLAGIGFGLFIDEVGKFITVGNDYFYPLAAPLIYASFLLTVLAYLHVRRLRIEPARADVYRVLDALERGVDPYSTQVDYTSALGQLNETVARSLDPQVTRLAEDAIHFLEARGFRGAAGNFVLLDRWRSGLQSLGSRWLTPGRMRLVLTVGFFALGIRGLFATLAVGLMIPFVSDPVRWQQLAATPMSQDELLGVPRLLLVATGLLLDSITGLLLLTAAFLLIVGRLRKGLQFGYWGLVLSLTAVQLVMFYINQFDVIAAILMQFGLLFGVVHYRDRHLMVENTPSQRN